MKNKLFITILWLTALALAFNVAYISVFGLSKLFAGAYITIIIMAASLEIAKIVSVSYLYRYWKIINKFFRTYLIVVVLGLMLLTSLGVYGYLTNAYQQTANKMEIVSSKVKIAENKKKLFIAELDRYNKQIDMKNKRINKLTDIRDRQEIRIDSLVNRRWGTKTTEQSIANANQEVQNLNLDITEISKKVDVVNDSVAYYDQKIIELQNTDVTAEIGPLKYLSNLTGKSMDKIINWLVLLIIFVFDPLAITLIVGANQLVVYNIKVKNKLIKDVLFGYDIEEESTEHPEYRIKKFFKMFFKKTKKDEIKELVTDVVKESVVEESVVEESVVEVPEKTIVKTEISEEILEPKIQEKTQTEIEFPEYAEENHTNDVDMDIEVDDQVDLIKQDVEEKKISDEHKEKKEKILSWIKRNFKF